MPAGKTKKRRPQKKTNTGRIRNKKSRSFMRKTLMFLLKAFIVGVILFSLFFMAVFFGFTGHVPSSRQLNEISNPQASEVYSENGRLLGRYYVENRSNVRFGEISPHVINALIATEDVRFYEHRGIDEIALMRVFFKTILLRDRSSGGGSTLSQQMAKNLFPRKDFGILSLPVNKLREAIIAYRVERIYTKEEILTLYLNTVPFGENIFGIEVAAERFFSKKPGDLTVDEAAVLVGMLKANYTYNPRINPEESKHRRNVVISQMVKNQFLSPEKGEAFMEKSLEIHYQKISYNEGPAPYFLEMLKPELLDWCAANTKENGEPWNLYTDGLRIETTLNYDFQHFARQSVKEYMKNLQNVFDSHWENSDPWRGDPDILKRAIRRTERYQRMKSAGYSAEQIETAFNQKITTSLFTWDGLKKVETTPLDSVKHYLRFLNSGFLALDPVTGAIKAWVGGIDFRFFKYDHVLSDRQTGSTFKPIVYLAALENGVSPIHYFPNRKKVYEAYQGWSPSNTDGDYTGYYTMEGALSRSINTVSVEILMETGIRNAIATARKLGVEADLPNVPSLALGVASISLKDLLSAYATLINEGVRTETYYLRSISTSDGQLLEKFDPPFPQKTDLEPLNCRMITHMLETAIREGTGTKIRSVYQIPGDFAGKTGTTQNHSDGWFIGLTPSLITGCWVGAEDPGIHFRSITYGQGSYMALPIVGKFFHKLYNDPRYRELRNARFPELNRELLADLDIPPYKEMLKMERRKENLLDRLFAGKEKEPEEQLRPREESQPKKEQKGLWQSLKGLFKKDKK